MNVLFGKIFDKVGTRIGFVLSIGFWSLSTALHAFAKGVVSFSIFRALLGVSVSLRGSISSRFSSISQKKIKQDEATNQTTLKSNKLLIEIVWKNIIGFGGLQAPILLFAALTDVLGITIIIYFLLYFLLLVVSQINFIRKF